MLEVDGERCRQNSGIKRRTVCLLFLFFQCSGAPNVLTQKWDECPLIYRTRECSMTDSAMLYGQ
jgi:hypothetical protein